VEAENRHSGTGYKPAQASCFIFPDSFRLRLPMTLRRTGVSSFKVFKDLKGRLGVVISLHRQKNTFTATIKIYIYLCARFAMRCGVAAVVSRDFAAKAGTGRTVEVDI
jgi:hypothetical protein